MPERTRSRSSASAARSRLPQSKLFDGRGYSIMVVRGCFMPAKISQLRNAVSHHHRNAREGKHFQFIVIVADGHHFRAGQTASGGPFCERRTFGTLRMNDVDHREIAALVNRGGNSELLS